MSWFSGLPIIGDLIDLGSTWIKGKNEQAKIKAQARADLARQQLSAKENWEQVALANSGWKDEYLTVLITIPMIACFIPGGAAWAAQGFAALENTPDWYPPLIGIVFGATFGRKELPRVLASLKAVFSRNTKE